jgi:competence ComEA-like helix-hairpin-helix protein
MTSTTFGLSALLVTSIALAGAQDPQSPPAGAPAQTSTEVLTVVEEEATPVFNKMCTKCHTPDRVLGQRRTRTQWEEVLEKMTKLGAAGTDEEWDTVQTYLLKHYGRLNINRAPADDIALVLGVTPEEAAAIVGYRKEKGEFTDFDALTKVPGVKLEKLQQSRTAITF